MFRRALFASLLSCICSVTLVIGCSDDEGAADSGAAGGETVNGLTPAQASEVLFKVGDTNVTVGEFAARLAEQSPYLRARYNSPERRRDYLDNMIRFELMAAEAHRMELDQTPEVSRTRKQVMIQQMMKQIAESQVQLSDITDEDINQYYEAHQSEFHKAEQVRASHILIKSRVQAQRMLQQVLQHENDVNFFRGTAEQWNVDPVTRDRFGDLRFFSRPGERGEGEPAIADAVAEAAFSIEQIGRIHPRLVQTEAGFHIIKLTGRRAALNRTLEEARRPIQNRLWRERREAGVQEFIDGLRGQAGVEENFGMLSDVQIDLPEGGSPTTEMEVPAAPDPNIPAPAGP